MLKRYLVLVLLLIAMPLSVMAAPDLVLRDIDGRAHPVADFIGKGKWTVVTVWSADCPICRREIHQMTFLHEDHKKGDIAVLGLSIDGQENRRHARAFAQEHGLNFPNLLDEWHVVERLTGRSFKGTPSYYIFTPAGDFAAQRVGAASQEEIEGLIQKLRTGPRTP